MPKTNQTKPEKSAASTSKQTGRLRSKTVGTAATTGNKVEVRAKIKSGKMRGRSVTVLLDTDDIVREQVIGQVNGFVTFLREHAIVGLAVGFVVGMQAQSVVKQLITSFIEPAFQVLFGGTKLSDRSFWLNDVEFKWGAMAYALINLLFVLAVIYALIKVFKLDKLDAKKSAADKEASKPKKDAKKSARKKADSES